MFTASNQLNVTLICGPTDMRKAIDGLCNIVAYDLEKEPCSDHIFFVAEHEIKSKYYNGLLMAFGCIISVSKKDIFSGLVLMMSTCPYKYHPVS